MQDERSVSRGWKDNKMGLKMDKLINCGERKIQIHSRIALTDICTRYGIQEGDAVEVFIRKRDCLDTVLAKYEVK